MHNGNQHIVELLWWIENGLLLATLRKFLQIGMQFLIVCAAHLHGF